MKFLLKLLLPLSLINGLTAQVDTFYADSLAGTSQGNTVLETGKNYRIVISGTWSRWADQNLCSGTPEGGVFFPSENSDNGKGYIDPSFIFAYPAKSSYCLGKALQLPASHPLNYWNGAEWADLIPITNEYREDHTYEYVVAGSGEAFQIRLPDDLLVDNYGQLKVEIHDSPFIALTTYTHENLKLEFVGVLQSSDDGAQWTDLSPQPASPYLISAEKAKPLLRTRNP